MSSRAHKVVSDENWTQLITLASGFLSLEQGDVKASMARAIAAHAELIRAIKEEQISVELPGGTVTMFVPDEGGVALRTQRPTMAQKLAAAPTELGTGALPGINPVVPGGVDDPTEGAP